MNAVRSPPYLQGSAVASAIGFGGGLDLIAYYFRLSSGHRPPPFSLSLVTLVADLSIVVPNEVRSTAWNLATSTLSTIRTGITREEGP